MNVCEPKLGLGEVGAGVNGLSQKLLRLDQVTSLNELLGLFYELPWTFGIDLLNVVRTRYAKCGEEGNYRCKG